MTDFTPIFIALRTIMLPYAQILDCTTDTDSELSVYTRSLQPNGKPLWFGGVQIKKRYVSYHLMPIYVNPALLEGISSALQKRLHGKSCFNFAGADPILFGELATLTEAGFRDYQAQGYVVLRAES